MSTPPDEPQTPPGGPPPGPPPADQPAYPYPQPPYPHAHYPQAPYPQAHYPQPPYSYPQPQRAAQPPPVNYGNELDATVSWMLFGLQVLATLLLGLTALFSVSLGGSCAGWMSDGGECNTDLVFWVVMGYWSVLVTSAGGTMAALLAAKRAGRPRWAWALGGCAVTGLAAIVFSLLSG